MSVFIEVAVPEGTNTTERGRLLEKLAERLLKTQNYEVTTQVRLTGMEVDLLACDRGTGEKIYVECKAYRSTIAAEILDKLLGQVVRRRSAAGWLIATYELGKDAKGIVQEFAELPPEERRKLQVFDPIRLVERLVNAGLVKSPGTLSLPSWAKPTAESYLLITALGEFWARPTTDDSSGVRTAVLLFDAATGQPINDPQKLSVIRSTDTTLAELEWVPVESPQPMAASTKLKDEIQSIVQVPRAEKWADYRPSRPQDFVGRDQLLTDVFKFFEDVRCGSNATRLFALKAPSGWGKSSTVVKVSDKARSKPNKNKYFVYAVDSRAASSRRFGEFALLRAIREAAAVNFIPSIEGLTLGGADSPFSGSGMADVVKTLREEQKVICLIFDQFEELLYRPELSSVFDDIKLLCNAVSSAQENVVIGFSWKTDGTITAEHKAYHMWHTLADHRMEFDLKPFNAKEISSALTRFSSELGQPLAPNLKRMLKDHCSGYPWLLKKLAIHIYDLVKSGMDQAAVLDKSLNISDLFDRELQGLTEAEEASIRHIAENSPAEFFKVVELFGGQIVDMLIGKRFVIRSGQKLTLYWDIFRDYVLTGKVPTIPVNYIPKANLATYVEGLRFIQSNGQCTFGRLGSVVKLGEGAVDNLVRDYVAVGHAESIRASGIVKAMCANEAESANVLFKFCQSHALYMSIRRQHGDLGFVTEAEFIESLTQMYKHEGYSALTHKLYALRLINWFESMGLLAKSGGSYKFTKPGGQLFLPSGAFHRNVSYFSGHATPEAVTEALDALKSGMLGAQEFGEKYERQAGVLRALNLVTYSGKQVSINFPSTLSTEQAIAEAASKAQTICIAREMIKANSKVKGEELGKALGEEMGLDWSVGSARRIGNAVKRWTIWCDVRVVGETIAA